MDAGVAPLNRSSRSSIDAEMLTVPAISMPAWRRAWAGKVRCSTTSTPRCHDAGASAARGGHLAPDPSTRARWTAAGGTACTWLCDSSHTRRGARSLVLCAGVSRTAQVVFNRGGAAGAGFGLWALGWMEDASPICVGGASSPSPLGRAPVAGAACQRRARTRVSNVHAVRGAHGLRASYVCGRSGEGAPRAPAPSCRGHSWRQSQAPRQQLEPVAR